MGTVDRRTFVAGFSAALAGPALAGSPLAGRGLSRKGLAEGLVDRGAAQIPSALSVIAAYEAATGGHVGMQARNVATGRTMAWRPDERMVMCSTFKASLAACVLSRVDHGRATLTDMVRFTAADVEGMYAPAAQQHLARGVMSLNDLCQAVVEVSDNSCANILLREIGGPAVLTRFWRSTGDDVSRLDDIEPALNWTPPGGLGNTTTARAMARTLETLALGPTLSTTSRATFVAWLKGCRTGDHRLRAGVPRGWAIGDKTGNNGKDGAGDLALIWPTPDRTGTGKPIVVSVYTRGGTPSEAQFETLFSGIGRAVAANLA